MIEDLIIWGPQVADEHSTLTELSEPDRRQIAEKLRRLDEEWQTDLDRSARENSYDNDDYLFVSDILQDIRELHKTMFYDPSSGKFIKENREIPYIHLSFNNQSAVKISEWGGLMADDKKLNMSVCPPLKSGAHILKFNYYWLKRYLLFLQNVFDTNEEEVISCPQFCESESFVDYATKAEAEKIAFDLMGCGLNDQAKSLFAYIDSFIDCDKIPKPILAFLRFAGEDEIITWVYCDPKSGVLKIPLKKKIYNTSGFAQLFENRVELVTDLFINSLKMILAHETAHVARGHWLLREKEPEYSEERNVMMNCEINADWTAAQWILNELIYDTVDGNPHSNIIAYTEERLVYLMSVRILAIYLALRWTHKEEEDKVWSEKTLNDFLENDEATHPIYQFRLFCVLGNVKRHLDHMAAQTKKAGHGLVTADGKELDKKLFDKVWQRACDMIFSFESAFMESLLDNGSDEITRIRDSLFIKDNAAPDEKEKVPFFICYMDRALKELAEYEKEWPKILEKLRKYGMFLRM